MCNVVKGKSLVVSLFLSPASIVVFCLVRVNAGYAVEDVPKQEKTLFGHCHLPTLLAMIKSQMVQ